LICACILNILNLDSSHSFLHEKHCCQWDRNNWEWEEVKVECVEEPSVNNVHCVKEWMSNHCLLLWSVLLLSWLSGSNCSDLTFDCHVIDWSKVNRWNIDNGLESNVWGDQLLCCLSLSSFHDVDGLSNPHHCHLDEPKDESNMWVSKLLWMAQSELHHVNARFSSWNTSDVKQKCAEDQSQLQWNVIVHSELHISVECNTEWEEYLNSTDQESFEEESELVWLSHFQLFLVCFNESEIGCRVNISWDFHGLFSLNAHVWFFSDCKSWLNIWSIVVKVQAVSLNFLNDGLDVGVNLVLTVILVDFELLIEKKILSPFEILLTPGQVILEHLDKSEEI